MLRNLARRFRRWALSSPASPDDEYYRVSFAQEGEDLLLLSLFAGHATGFYVDVGAHHPRRYSNTLALYSRGWSGINIDAMPGSMRPFREMRSRDINLELAISDERRELTFYEFNEPALNGFDPELARRRAGLVPAGQSPDAAFRIVAEHRIQTVTLAEVLDKHLPAGREIDVLNVDVEGLDLAVLASNDWTRYRPTVILAEDPDVVSLLSLGSSRVARFLREHGYVPLCKTPLTLLFAREERVVRDALGPRLARAGETLGDASSVRPAT